MTPEFELILVTALTIFCMGSGLLVAFQFLLRIVQAAFARCRRPRGTRIRKSRPGLSRTASWALAFVATTLFSVLMIVMSHPRIVEVEVPEPQGKIPRIALEWAEWRV